MYRLLELGSIMAFFAAASAPVQTIDAFGYKWSVPTAAEWAVDKTDHGDTVRMLVARPSTQPRRPAQQAIAETEPFTDVTLEAEVKRDNTSLILIYAYRDENHFNYAHLSADRAAEHPVHNGMFHVYGGDRVRISTEEGPAALPTQEWTPVKLTYSARTGEAYVEVAGRRLASLHAVDLSLGAGRVGIGSFFETAQFRNVKITGTRAGGPSK